MKILFDFLPIALFFAVFKWAGAHAEAAAAFASRHFGGLVAGGVIGAAEAPMLLATLVVIAATLVQVAVLKLRGRKVDTMLWISLALVVVMGGATVWFHDATFIKWKPTILYWVMAAVFGGAPLLAGRNLLRTLLASQLRAPDAVWSRLNLAWVVFFVVMGALNLLVAYTFSTDAWVNWKLFGALGMMLIFVLAQGAYLSRHAEQVAEGAPGDAHKS